MGELAAHQISEIVPAKGVTLVGPLPKELQKVTTYSAGVAAKTTAPELARGFEMHGGRIWVESELVRDLRSSSRSHYAWRRRTT